MSATSNLTPEFQEEFVSILRRGNYPATACAVMGISQATYKNWMLKGEAGKDPKYYEFYLAVNKALGQVEDEVVDNWTNAIPEDWKAGSEFLARRFPERWGKQETLRVAQTNTDHQIIELKIDPNDANTIEGLHNLMEAIRGEEKAQVELPEPSIDAVFEELIESNELDPDQSE